MSGLVVEHANDAGEWDGFVRAQPGWTQSQLAGWRQVMEGAFGHRCDYLIARTAGGEIRGVLPLVRVRSLLFGRSLVSMPYLNYGGPLGERAAVRALCARAAEIASQWRAKRLELRCTSAQPIDLTASTHKVTCILPLPADGPEALLASFPAKLRSQVRRTARDGADFRFGRDQMDAFVEVFSRHMTRLGTPTHSPRFFTALCSAFQDDVWVGCVYQDGRPVAGGIGLRGNGEIEMTWAAALAEYKRSAPNMWLYWRFMERAAREGLRRFNFGRCTPGSGTHRFKQQWGAVDHPLWWYSNGAEAGAPAAPRGAQLGPTLWKRMPVSVARVVGPWVRRGIPL